MVDHLLTKKKKAWVRQFKPTATMSGTPLVYNHAAELRYRMRLKALTDTMVRETEKELRKLFDSDAASAHFAQDDNVASQARIITNGLQKKFQQLFNKRSKGLADMVVSNAKADSKTALHVSLKQLSGGLSLKTDIMTNELASVLIASTAENVGLIKSIPQQYLGKVQGAVMRSIATGNGLQDLIPALKKISKQTDRRVELLALDQTRKTFTGINRARMKAVGIKKARWLHSGGSNEPRPTHIAMSGKVFLLDEGMYDSAVGKNIQPGEEPNCRCTYVPVIEFEDGEADD